MSCIKSVQRGTGTVAVNGSVEIAISEVNPDKCLCFVSGNGTVGNTYSYGRCAVLPRLGGINSTSIIILTGYTNVKWSSDYTDSVNFSWQLIEFA